MDERRPGRDPVPSSGQLILSQVGITVRPMHVHRFTQPDDLKDLVLEISPLSALLYGVVPGEPPRIHVQLIADIKGFSNDTMSTHIQEAWAGGAPEKERLARTMLVAFAEESAA